MSRAQLTSTVEQNTGGAVAPYVAGKNKIINGDFGIWQRGTSFTATGYTSDRWYSFITGTATIAQETSIIPSGSTYALKWTTGAASSYVSVLQPFEDKDVNYMAGNTITLSAQVRALASFSGNATMYIETNTTANIMNGGTWTQVASVNYAPSTSAYGKMQLSYAVPAGTKGLRVNLTTGSAQASGTGLYWGQVQVEIGSVATPFTTATGTLSGELAACQRYYYRVSTNNNYQIYGGNGLGQSTTRTTIVLKHPVTLRTATAALDYSNVFPSDGTNILSTNISSIYAVNSTVNDAAINIDFSSANPIQYRPYYLQNATSTAYYGFNAEL